MTEKQPDGFAVRLWRTLTFSPESGAAFAAGDVNISLAFGNSQIRFAVGADEEFIILSLVEFGFVHLGAVPHSAHLFHEMQIFQIAFLHVPGEKTISKENSPFRFGFLRSREDRITSTRAASICARYNWSAP